MIFGPQPSINRDLPPEEDHEWLQLLRHYIVRGGAKSSQLGLRPSDWDDPHYRYAYNHLTIYREDWDEGCYQSAEEYGFINLDGDEDGEGADIHSGPYPELFYD